MKLPFLWIKKYFSWTSAISRGSTQYLHKVVIKPLLSLHQAYLLNTDLEAGLLQTAFLRCHLLNTEVGQSRARGRACRMTEGKCPAFSCWLAAPVNIPLASLLHLALAFESSPQSYGFMYLFLSPPPITSLFASPQMLLPRALFQASRNPSSF